MGEIGIGAFLGGPDLGSFHVYHSQLVRLFRSLDGIEFCPAITFYGISFYVDGAAYRWPAKHGVNGVRYLKAQQSISVNVHLTDDDWRDKPLEDVKQYISEQFRIAFRAIAARLLKADVIFDREGFLAATDAVLAAFCVTPSNAQPQTGEIEIQKALRHYVDHRDLAHALGTPIPELNLRQGFRFERDPDDPDRVMIRRSFDNG